MQSEIKPKKRDYKTKLKFISVTNEDLIKQVHERTNEYKTSIKLVLSEYARISSRELLKGNVITFPKKFGSMEIINIKMPNKCLSENLGVFDFYTKIGIKLTAKNPIKMMMFGKGDWISTLKYIIKNKIRRYRYVDQ